MNSSVIVSVTTVIGSFTLVYLNSIKDSSDRKYNVRKEQLLKFYVPFYQRYRMGFFPQNQLSTMSIEVRSTFLDIMTQNIHLMEPLSQAMYSDFYFAFLNLAEAENGNPEYPYEKCAQKMDEVFEDLSKAIFIEYRQILKKCHLPVPLK